MPEAIARLGVLMGVSFTSGINLYLTVFLVGLFQWCRWLTNPPEGLAFLGHPAVVIVAGLLYAVEFFADKIPAVDDAWDAAHTFIRPVAAAVIAMKAVGELNPVVVAVAALLAGTIAASTHAAKAGSRVVVNTVPVPFLNSVVSVLEDIAVGFLTVLALLHPIVAFFVILALLGATWWLLPKSLRAWWLMLRTVGGLVGICGRAGRPGARVSGQIGDVLQEGEDLLVAVAGVNRRRWRKVPWLKRGAIALSKERLLFVFRRWLRTRAAAIPVEQVVSVRLRRRRLFVQLIIGIGERSVVILAPRSYRAALESFATQLAGLRGVKLVLEGGRIPRQELRADTLPT